VKLCNITASHSSCKDFNIAGILVADGGFGLTTCVAVNKKIKYNGIQFLEYIPQWYYDVSVDKI
jgi:hypothetical protein